MFNLDVYAKFIFFFRYSQNLRERKKWIKNFCKNKDKLYKLAKTKDFYPFTINLKKLIVHLSEQEKIIIKIKFFEKSTTEEVASWLGISKEKVRSAELKALKFLRTL